MRVRSSYTVKGKKWSVQWVDWKPPHAADVDYQTRTIRLAERLKAPEETENLDVVLRHELLHVILERPWREGDHHKMWTMSHSRLAKVSARLDKLIRTGSD